MKQELQKTKEVIEECINAINKQEEYIKKFDKSLLFDELRNNRELIDNFGQKEIDEYKEYFNYCINIISNKKLDILSHDIFIFKTINQLATIYSSYINSFNQKHNAVRKIESGFNYKIVLNKKMIHLNKLFLIENSNIISSLFDLFTEESELKKLKPLVQVKKD